MKNIFDHDDYHRYKSTTDDNDKNSISPVISGKGIIFFIIVIIIAFISSGASPWLILVLLGIGLIVYKIIKSIM